MILGNKAKEDFDPKEYDEHYAHHHFAPMSKYTDSDEVVARVAWVINQVKDVDKVLDLGCLDGYVLTTLAHKLGIGGVGVDLSSEGIDLAKRRTEGHGFDLEFHEQSIEDTDLGEKFKAIFLFEVIEHVKDPQKIYEVIDKHLHKDGSVYVTTPDYEGIYGDINDDPLHLRVYTHKDEDFESAISLSKEIGLDRVKYVSVVDNLIQLEYGW